ncbi:ATP-binding protein [Portibacter marinus]|uniref:ATP-binding protein n=1 Tax=Portibacter marinus TaxID=2898660 RepID=UPI001F401743|nr:ATP-binding protein [Portibacter marinus]
MRFLFLLSQLFLVSTISTQSIVFDREIKSTEHGMPDRLVNGIVRDSLGFIWLGTRNGLARSTPHSIKSFSTKSPLIKISENKIEQLSIASPAYLSLHVAQTSELNLDVINTFTGKINHIKSEKKNGVKGKVIARNFDLKGKSIVLSFQNDSLIISRFNFEDLKYHKVIAFSSQAFNDNYSNSLNGVKLFETSDYYWVSLWQNKNQNVLLNINKDYRTKTEFIFGPTNSEPYAISELHDGRIIAVDHRDRVVIYDHKSNLFKDWNIKIPPGTFSKYEDLSGNILFYEKDNYGKINHNNIWLLSSENEIKKYGQIFDGITSVFALYSDNLEKQLHIGTDRGYELVTLKSQKVASYAELANDNNFGISGRGIGRLDSLRILLSTENDGFHLLDTKSNALNRLDKHFKNHKLLLDSNSGRDLVKDSKGNLWGKSDTYTVVCFNGVSRKIDLFKTNNPEANLAIDGKDRLYLIGAHKISRLDPNSGKEEVLFDHMGNNPLDTVRGHYGTIFNDSLLWVCTSNGLLKMNIETGKCIIFRTQESIFLKYRDIFSTLTMSDKGLLYVGSMVNGLYIFNPKTEKFVDHLEEKDGLCNNNVVGILEDWDQCVWISTYNGLSLLDPQENTFSNFYPDDGFNQSEFNRYSFFRDDQDSLLYFGGMNGFNAFNPSELMDNYASTPSLRFDEITWFDGHSRQDSNLLFFENQNNSIVVSPHNRSVNVSFSLIDIGDPKYHQYAYKIKGLDQNWIYQGSEPVVRINYLPAGKHNLLISGRNKRGTQAYQNLELEIQVLQFWYLRWWAILTYLGVVGTMIYILYKFNLRRRLALSKANQLQELNNFKDNFFTNVTHEFRTPLTIIIGASDLIHTKLTQLKDENAAYLSNLSSTILSSGQTLLENINQILNVSKQKNTTWNIKYVQGDVIKFLTEIALGFESLASKKGIHFELKVDTEDIIMDYDSEKLRIILHNLLSNAFKYTQKGGRVEMSIKEIKLSSREDLNGEESNYLLIEVHDTGIGILEEDQSRIFEKYYQVVSELQTGGSGIGLSLVKEIIEKIGAKLEVTSTLGKGSTFSVMLPIEKAALSISESTGLDSNFHQDDAPRLSEENIELLIIEDNIQISDFLTQSLKHTAKITTARNGKEGLEIAKTNIPDIILSDIMMPIMDGLEVVETLKKTPAIDHIPIVLLTAKSDIEDRIMGMNVGADAYLAKPFNVRELIATLENILKQRELLRAYHRRILLAELDPVNEKDNDEASNFVTRAKSYIEENIENPEIQGEDLAQLFNMSYWTFNRKIAALTGLTPNKFIRSVRLERSKHLLKNSSKNISEVAYAVGFKDPKYFTRVFTMENELNPTEWKEQVEIQQ